MKIYTKTGDDGTTGLIGGKRVPKNDPRIECFGTVDELNAAIGLSAAGAEASLAGMLTRVQDELFNIGAHLSAPADAPRNQPLPALHQAIVEQLEREIDAADALLPPLHQFILPGGTELSCRLHLARTICRRAERRLLDIEPIGEVERFVLIYLNRLSDWLFVQARVANFQSGVSDVPWSKTP